MTLRRRSLEDLALCLLEEDLESLRAGLADTFALEQLSRETRGSKEHGLTFEATSSPGADGSLMSGGIPKRCRANLTTAMCRHNGFGLSQMMPTWRRLRWGRRAAGSAIVEEGRRQVMGTSADTKDESDMEPGSEVAATPSGSAQSQDADGGHLHAERHPVGRVDFDAMEELRLVSKSGRGATGSSQFVEIAVVSRAAEVVAPPSFAPERQPRAAHGSITGAKRRARQHHREPWTKVPMQIEGGAYDDGPDRRCL